MEVRTYVCTVCKGVGFHVTPPLCLPTAPLTCTADSGRLQRWLGEVADEDHREDD